MALEIETGYSSQERACVAVLRSENTVLK